MSTHAELLARHRRALPDWLALYYKDPIALVSGEGRHVIDAEGRRWQLTLVEGKYHEVRRMMRAVEAPVITLERITYATQSLSDVAEPGSWRRLADDEVAALYASVSATPGSSVEGWIEL